MDDVQLLQWDLNYSNPWVFRAMAGEMMFLANLGVDILRMDAVAFYLEANGLAAKTCLRHTL